MSAEVGVILAQVGTPMNLGESEVRRYLREFLSDQRVIDLPKWRWQPILRSAVLPSRPRQVIEHFKEIWTDEGSPLLVFSQAQRDGVQERLGDRFQVELGFAYSEPSLGGAVTKLEQAGIRKIVVLPLFPQFSNSTTAAVYDEVIFHALGRGKRRGLPKKKFVPTLRFVHPYFDDPSYISVLAGSVDRQLSQGPQPDRIVVSYHGLPQRFPDEGDPYVTHCEATTRLLAAELGWPEDYYEMAYQSRFGRAEWIKPYLQPRLTELHGAGFEQPAILSPGFTTDCLETLHELGIEGRELFEDGGGDPSRYRTLSCLNAEPEWLDYAANLVEQNAGGW